MTNHLFSYVNGNELLSVVNSKGVAYELGNYCAGSIPDLDYLLLSRLVHLTDFLKYLGVNVGPLLQ